MQGNVFEVMYMWVCFGNKILAKLLYSAKEAANVQNIMRIFHNDRQVNTRQTTPVTSVLKKHNCKLCQY